MNTCAFTRTPARRRWIPSSLARHKEADPSKRLVVAGCLVQRFGEPLAAELPEADYLIGVHDFPGLAKILGQRPGANAPRLLHLAPPYAYPGPEARYPATPGHLAYLKIAEGWGHRCSLRHLPDPGPLPQPPPEDPGGGGRGTGRRRG